MAKYVIKSGKHSQWERSGETQVLVNYGPGDTIELTDEQVQSHLWRDRVQQIPTVGATTGTPDRTATAAVAARTAEAAGGKDKGKK